MCSCVLFWDLFFLITTLTFKSRQWPTTVHFLLTWTSFCTLNMPLHLCHASVPTSWQDGLKAPIPVLLHLCTSYSTLIKHFFLSYTSSEEWTGPAFFCLQFTQFLAYIRYNPKQLQMCSTQLKGTFPERVKVGKRQEVEAWGLSPGCNLHSDHFLIRIGCR